MASVSRRTFLGSTFAGLAGGCLLQADDSPQAKKKRVTGEGAAKTADSAAKKQEKAFETTLQPDTLFLTWQRDPTTTMTIQWVGTRGETADSYVYYAPLPSGAATAQPTIAKPYPLTDFKVFRAVLTGLTP